MEEMIRALLQYGIVGIILAYFIFKDWYRIKNSLENQKENMQSYINVLSKLGEQIAILTTKVEQLEKEMERSFENAN